MEATKGKFTSETKVKNGAWDTQNTEFSKALFNLALDFGSLFSRVWFSDKVYCLPWKESELQGLASFPVSSIPLFFILSFDCDLNFSIITLKFIGEICLVNVICLIFF